MTKILKIHQRPAPKLGGYEPSEIWIDDKPVMITVPCTHTRTMGREGETGGWCVGCGEKVYETETRECQDCKWFKDLGLHNRPPICKKHLMGVFPQMHVYYNLQEGSCFEAGEMPERI
jgi:hypothetical protein